MIPTHPHGIVYELATGIPVRAATRAERVEADQNGGMLTITVGKRQIACVVED